MGLLNWAIAVSLLVVSSQAVSWTATPFNPHSVPLAVRTPYVSTWLPQGTGAALNAVWPTFWTGHVTRLCPSNEMTC